MPTKYLRVRDKATGHEYTVRANRFDPKVHEKSDEPALDVHGEPAPPTHQTSSVKPTENKTATKADTEKES